MSDGMLATWGDETMDAQEAREAAEGNLCPRGRWPGELQPRSEGRPADLKKIETEAGGHPLEGKEIYQCHAVLHTDEGDKHIFFDAYPLVVKATSKAGGSYMRVESTNGGFLYNATKMFGQPFRDVLQYAMEHSLVYDIGVKKATDENPAKNTIKGIYPQEG